jgi:hypothetical protein
MEHRERSGTGGVSWFGNEVTLLLTAEEEVIPTEVPVEFVSHMQEGSLHFSIM